MVFRFFYVNLCTGDIGMIGAIPLAETGAVFPQGTPGSAYHGKEHVIIMKRFLVLGAAVLLSGVLPAGAKAESTLDVVKRKGVLVAGVSDSAPPFGFVDWATEEIVGADVDMARAIAKRLCVGLKIRTVTPANRIPELIDGNIDIILTTMSRSPERAALIDLSNTCVQTGQKFLVKAETVASLKDPEGKLVPMATPPEGAD